MAAKFELKRAKNGIKPVNKNAPRAAVDEIG